MKSVTKNILIKAITIGIIFTILASYVPAVTSIVMAVTEENLEKDNEEIIETETNNLTNDTTEIIIENEKIKKQLKENYDTDRDGKITAVELEGVEEFSFSNYEDEEVNMEFLKYCKNLKRIFLYGNCINTQVLSGHEYLEIVSISENKNDINWIETLTKLKELSLYRSNITNIDLNNINNKITSLSLKNEDLNNIDFITRFTNLVSLDLGGNQIEDFSILESMSIQNVYIRDQIIRKDVGTKIINSEPIEIELPTLFIKALSIDGYRIETLTCCTEDEEYITYSDEITLSEDKTKIIIKPINRMGKRTAHMLLTNSNYMNMYGTSLYIDYNIDSNADNTTEIDIGNETLKKQLLEKHDIDKDGKITVYDMENILDFNFGIYNEEADLECLKYCKSLNSINLYGKVKNTQAIGNLEYLKSINIRNVEDDISWIKSLKNLKSLSLYNCNISNIDWENVSVTLRNLALEEVNLTNIDFLTRFTNLTYLNLANNEINDITPLKQLSNLITVRLDLVESNFETIEQLDIEYVHCNQKVELGEIYVEKGEIREIEIPTIIKKAIDPNSKLYCANENGENIINFMVSENSEVPLEMVYDKSKGKILIDATKANVENTNKIITMSSESFEGWSISANIRMQLIIHQSVEEKVEIVIADEDLKEYFLKNYDADKDGKITNYDMLQIRKYNSNNLTIIEHAKNLEILNRVIYENEDLLKINELPLLKSLSLGGKATERLSEITILNQLETLILYSASDKMDYDIISGLTNLKKLSIDASQSSKLIDLSKMKDLTNLETLSINSKVFNAEALGSLTKLKELSLHTNDTLDNIDFISNFTELERLYLYNNLISDITSLRNLEKLKYVDLIKNPINTKEVETAKTLQILKDRKTNVNIIETNITENIEFKDESFKRALLADGIDLNKDNQISIDELQRVTYISLGEEDGKIASLDGIEYAQKLSSLSIYNRVEDITAILKLPQLESISLGNLATKENIETLGRHTTVKTIYVYDTYLTDLEIFSNMSSLETLNIYSHYDTNNIVNLNGIEKLTNLERLTLAGNIKNINLIKNIPNLKSINLYDKVYNENEEKEETIKIIELLNSMNLEEVRLSMEKPIEINLGNFLVGSEQKRDITELSDIIKSIYTPENVLYSEKLDVNNFTEERIAINDKEVTINTEKLGRNTASISLYNQKFSGTINLTWRNIIQGDDKKEIHIPDENLKKALLETEDVDGDKRITDNDIINIVELSVFNKNISSLEGLQYAKNMTGINASYNNISDLAPIANLDKITAVSVVNNIITDVTLLNNVKWTENAVIILYENHINFEDENENYQAFKNLIYSIPNSSEEGKAEWVKINTKRQYKIDANRLDEALVLDENLKNKLIELNIDTNNNKEISVRELKRATIVRNSYEIDLSNSNITNISGLENISSTYIDLSGNNIDMTKQENKSVKTVLEDKGTRLKIEEQIEEQGKATVYIVNENGYYSSNSNIGVVNTELNENIEYKFIPETDRTYYPENSENNLAGLFINTAYYSSDEEHKAILEQEGYDIEVVITGAIRTKEALSNNATLTTTLKVPEQYIGSEARANNVQTEIVKSNKNTITITVDLNKYSEDDCYYTINSKIYLRLREQIITNTENNEEIIEAIQQDQNVTLNMKEEVKEISNQIFEKLSEKENVELKVETQKAKWTFNSDTITNKEINLNPTVTLSDTRFENMEAGPSEDGIFIKFDHEGVLPGKAEIELDIKDCASKYENGKTVYLYYYNSAKKKYEYISTVTANDQKVKIMLEHCSEYFITDEKLFDLGDVSGDGDVTTKDAKLILQHIAGKITLTQEQETIADVSKDGKVTTKDAKIILQYIAGKIESL